MMLARSKAYSDGWTSNLVPGSQRNKFTKCPTCGAFFKITDSLVRKAKSEEIDRASLLSLSWTRGDVHSLSIKEYRQAISFELFNSGPEGSDEWKEDMLSLRIELWQAYNRNGMEDASAEQKAIYADNCRKILSMLTGKTDDDCILRAELHRNIGEFDKCRSSLEDVKCPDEEASLFISGISTACDAKNTLTVCIDDPDVPILNYLPEKFMDMDNVISASAGDDYTVAIKSDGTLWT